MRTSLTFLKMIHIQKPAVKMIQMLEISHNKSCNLGTNLEKKKKEF